MTCMICGTSFELLSWGGPHIPCDCGAEVTRKEWQAMDPGHFEELKSNWREALRREAEDARRRNEREL